MASKRKYDFVDSEIPQLLLQKSGASVKDLKGDMLLIGYALKYPKELPMLMKEIAGIKPTREIRIGLAAVVTDCEIRMRGDMEKYQLRKFAANIIEKALFGEEFLEGDVKLVEEKKGKGRKKS